jgi:Ca2+-binding EF-hand superfamily protein
VRALLKASGFEMGEEEAAQLMRHFDVDGNETMDAAEYTQMVDAIRENRDARLRFDEFDDDGSGELDAVEVRLLLAAEGYELDEAEVAAVMARFDVDEGGTLDREEYNRLALAVAHKVLSTRGSVARSQCRFALLPPPAFYQIHEEIRRLWF